MQQQRTERLILVAHQQVVQVGVCFVDGCKHLLVAVKLFCQPRQLLPVAQNLLVERNEERQTQAFIFLLLIVEIDIFVDALDFRSVLQYPLTDDAVVYFDVWLCKRFGEIIQTEDFLDASNIQHLFRCFVDVGEMLCNGCLHYLRERLHVVHELRQILVNESIGDCCGFLPCIVHILSVFVETSKIGSEVSKLADYFPLLLVLERINKVFANEFLLENRFICLAASKPLCDDAAQIVLDFLERCFIGFAAFRHFVERLVLFHGIVLPFAGEWQFEIPEPPFDVLLVILVDDSLHGFVVLGTLLVAHEDSVLLDALLRFPYRL